MGGQPRREGNTSTDGAKKLVALPKREVFQPQGIDRNPIADNSQRIRGSKDMSGTNGSGAGVLPQVSGKGRDDQMGEIPAFSQDG